MIKIPEESLVELSKQMVEDMKKSKRVSGKITYEIKAPEVEREAVIAFTPEAFAEMVSLIMVFDKEVGWYCTCKRHGDPDDDIYLIDDVLVFPQKTSGVTVDSDDEKRLEWFDSLPVETLVNIKCDCHSHVNMGVTPSGTDEKDMNEVLDNLDGDSFRIFMIWNKKLDYSCKIFDMQKNVMFDTDDVFVEVIGMAIGDFVEGAKEMVGQKTYNYTPSTTKVTTTKQKPKQIAAAEIDDDFDDDDDLDGFYQRYLQDEAYWSRKGGSYNDYYGNNYYGNYGYFGE